jgi:hypothetical protein
MRLAKSPAPGPMSLAIGIPRTAAELPKHAREPLGCKCIMHALSHSRRKLSVRPGRLEAPSVRSRDRTRHGRERDPPHSLGPDGSNGRPIG